MGKGVNPIPEGFHTVTPYMTIKDASDAIEFYKEAFGATEIFRWADQDGRVRHAEVVIGDSPIMLTDEAPDFGMAGPQSLTDPFGHVWYIGTHVEDISREELQKRYDAMVNQ
jgi:PhnB protein